MLEIGLLLNKLSKKRELFHNEKDFQFYFTLELIEERYEIRLEKYVGQNNGKRKYIDLEAYDKKEDQWYLFEFKYKTKEEIININNEKYELFEQGARDLGCYAFLNDVSRLEEQVKKYKEENKKIKAYAIFLTNDERYLNGFKSNCLCVNYGLKDKKVFKKGVIDFIIPDGKTKDGTCVKDLDEITLLNDYDIKWNDYSNYLKELILEIK